MKVRTNGAWEDWGGASIPAVPVTGRFPEANYSTLFVEYGDALWDSLNPVFSDNMSGDRLYAGLPVTTITKFPTSVSSAPYMFLGCGKLTTVPAIDFTKMQFSATGMFSGCASLVQFTAPVSAPTAVDSMFSGCYRLTTVGSIDTSAASNASSMFSGCSALTTVGPFEVSKASSVSKMFEGCTSLASLPVTSFPAARGLDSLCMSCTSLTSVSGVSASVATSLASMFSGCKSLTTVGDFTLGAGKVTNTSSMFYNCTSLTSVGRIDMSNATTVYSMFSGCTALTSVGVYGFRYSMTISGAKLDAAAINTLFQNAGTAASSSQTIDVRNNPGSAGCDPTIATAKGWTVLR